MVEPGKTPRRSAKKTRCAIYTRKSSDEGLEQAFNSLDAQREACAAFILSQKHEGWTVLPTLYDDGGFSGGSLERPALKRLLADIEAGQIDVIVVYKVDRLTRALSDFAKLVEIFEHRNVSFVSITQQFNTTTSMGRLTLNVLLSFAQFEREVIGERVRDKIAASKRKGMWMGGVPALGYDVKDRKLVVNNDEACTVVDIFYLALKSVRILQDELARAGIRSKRRVRPDGSEYGGQKLARGALYQMLQNRIYRGEITHKSNSYPGEHPAIIERQLWDEVQTVLAQNRVERATSVRAKHPSLLGGFVFDATGERLTPTYAVKKGTRYRYYISARLMREVKGNRSGGWRIPAGDLEGLVIERLRTFLADPATILDAVSDQLHPGSPQSQLIEQGGQAAKELEGRQAPDKVKATLMALLCRVAVHPDRIEINISRRRLAEWLSGQATDLTTRDQTLDHKFDDIVTLTVPARLKRVGREMRMLIENADDQTAADPSLLRIIARAHDIQGRLSQNTKLTVHGIAREERVTAAYLYTLLRLPWLAPDITTAIVNGWQPHQLNAMTLMRKASRLPAEWVEQRALLGFH
jgi:DNA invertase Pin-like site-specific DNA recombinase